MQSVHAPGYSDFFTSGIRVVSRRFAVEGHVRSTSLPVPIPLSFDSSSDSESETKMTKHRSWRTSMSVVPNPKPLLRGDRDPNSDGKLLDRKKQRRCSSLMSITHHLFRNRRHRISNDESGWLSSASSNSSFEDSIDLINSSAWPECPNGGLAYRIEPERDPEPFDPFSSSPASKSFFFDSETQTSRPLPKSSSRPPSNRFSLSSISSSASTSSLFSSTTKRNSTLSSSYSQSVNPPHDASFLHFPPSRRPSRTSVEVKRPASIHIIPSSSTWTSTPANSRSLTLSHSNYLPRDNSQARPQSLPVLHSSQNARSRVRSLFLSKSASIANVIPEGDQTEIDNNNDSDVDNGVPESDNLSSETREPEEEGGSSEYDRSNSRRLVIGDEEAPVSASDAQQFFGNTLEDLSKSVDWREFCLEILDG